MESIIIILLLLLVLGINFSIPVAAGGANIVWILLVVAVVIYLVKSLRS